MIALCFASCGTTADIPLDDAYIWPDKPVAPTQAAPSTPVTDTPSSITEKNVTPQMEIISAQDTTITVKIKR